MIKILIQALIISFFLVSDFSFTQTDPDSSHQHKVDYLKLSIIGGVTTGAFVWGYAIQNNLWWKGDKSKFYFVWKQDWVYALGADKYGHFYFPYLVSNIYTQAFEWAGIDETKSIWYASSFALAYETFVEVRDGFSKQWGFSWGDFSADFLGASFPVLQHYIPVLKNFNFKISFYPSDRFKAGSNRVIFDDYESTYDWLSINVYNFLPGEVKKFYPKFINLAIGHSVEKLDNNGGGNHRFYISLDWNLEGLPGDGWFWNLLKRNLNYYHLPAPAIQIYPHVIWYGIKF
ncbi:MAG: DUF2279 domain-containing protein [Ignavibacteriaceae bacterium]